MFPMIFLINLTVVLDMIVIRVKRAVMTLFGRPVMLLLALDYSPLATIGPSPSPMRTPLPTFVNMNRAFPTGKTRLYSLPVNVTPPSVVFIPAAPPAAIYTALPRPRPRPTIDAWSPKLVLTLDAPPAFPTIDAAPALAAIDAAPIHDAPALPTILHMFDSSCLVSPPVYLLDAAPTVLTIDASPVKPVLKPASAMHYLLDAAPVLLTIDAAPSLLAIDAAPVKLVFVPTSIPLDFFDAAPVYPTLDPVLPLLVVPPAIAHSIVAITPSVYEVEVYRTLVSLISLFSFVSCIITRVWGGRKEKRKVEVGVPMPSGVTTSKVLDTISCTVSSAVRTCDECEWFEVIVCAECHPEPFWARNDNSYDDATLACALSNLDVTPVDGDATLAVSTAVNVAPSLRSSSPSHSSMPSSTPSSRSASPLSTPSSRSPSSPSLTHSISRSPSPSPSSTPSSGLPSSPSPTHSTSRSASPSSSLTQSPRSPSPPLSPIRSSRSLPPPPYSPPLPAQSCRSSSPPVYSATQSPSPPPSAARPSSRALSPPPALAQSPTSRSVSLSPPSYRTLPSLSALGIQVPVATSPTAHRSRTLLIPSPRNSPLHVWPSAQSPLQVPVSPPPTIALPRIEGPPAIDLSRVLAHSSAIDAELERILTRYDPTYCTDRYANPPSILTKENIQAYIDRVCEQSSPPPPSRRPRPPSPAHIALHQTQVSRFGRVMPTRPSNRPAPPPAYPTAYSNSTSADFKLSSQSILATSSGASRGTLSVSPSISLSVSLSVSLDSPSSASSSHTRRKTLSPACAMRTSASTPFPRFRKRKTNMRRSVSLSPHC